MGSNRTKKQHYVPRLYLKHFAHEKKKNKYVYTKRKRTKKIIKERIENVASENWYYELTLLEDPQALEKFYSNEVEPFFDQHLNKIISSCNNVVIHPNARIINDSLKSEFSRDIVYQMLRGPVGREYLNKIYKEKAPIVAKNVKKELEKRGDSVSDKKIEEVLNDEKMLRLVGANVIIEPNRVKLFSEVLLSKTWIFYIINGNRQWISSDSPVIAIDVSSGDATLFKNGILKPSTVISIPISNKILLDIYDLRFGLGILYNRDCKRVYLDSENESKFISFRNQKQAEQCKELVFGDSMEELNKVNFYKA